MTVAVVILVAVIAFVIFGAAWTLYQLMRIATVVIWRMFM